MINIFFINNNDISISNQSVLRRNPIRMAQRWKLVPTLRHKQCTETSFCGVYIGNGCRKCPKCKTVQPQSTKRKRTSSPIKPRKKKAEIADGDPYKRYNSGTKVKVYWDAKKRWTWGRITHRTSSPITYRVRLLGITNDNGNSVLWHFNKISATHLKLRNTDDMLSEPNQPKRKDIVYENIYNVVQIVDKNESSHASIPTCNCCGCWRTFYNDNEKYLPRNMPARSPCLPVEWSELHKGSVIKSDAGNGWGILCEIVEFKKCVNPKYSFMRVKEADPDGKSSNFWTIKITDKIYSCKWFFQDGSNRPYFNEDNAFIETCANELKRAARGTLDTTIKKTFVRKMNNFQYNLHMQCQCVKLPSGNLEFNFNGCYQENTETSVKRSMVVEELKKPKPKELSEYKQKITAIVGTQHDWTWLDSAQAMNEFSTTKHPTNLKLLGCTKFNKPWNDLRMRKDFYDTYNVDYEQRRCFHGTYMHNLFPILHPMGGFAMASESNGKCYGQGVYFANSPHWVNDNGYCPTGVDKLRCVIVAQVLCSKSISNGTDTWHRNAFVAGRTSELRRSDSPAGAAYNAGEFELTGGNSTRSIHVVWYDRCKTDVNITHVLWYR
jgi:hypothetical protein